MKACGKIRRLFSSHFHTVRLFLFLDLLPQLLFNNRPLTVLMYSIFQVSAGGGAAPPAPRAPPGMNPPPPPPPPPLRSVT